MNVAVFDYGAGNVHSVLRALEHLGASATLTRDLDAAMGADGLVVPGVGSFDAVVTKLRTHRGDRVIERRLAGGRPVLGICVGLQVLFDSSTENDSVEPGLAQFPGSVTALEANIVPHMGWSHLEPGEGSVLLQGLADQRFYFVHSYGVQSDPLASMTGSDHFDRPIVSWARHGQPFIAAIESGPLSATQFHPEKSGEAGLGLLRNWIDTL